MRLPDLNLLLYAVNHDAREHTRAKAWLETRLSGTETVAIAWSVVLGFMRISTHPGIFPSPLTPAEALAQIDAWLARPNVVVIQPGEGHLVILRELLERAGTAGNLVTDAHLAALAIEHGATLESHDHDFGRFRGLRWEDPLS